MSGCADEVWGGKDRIAAILIAGIMFGDGIDHLALAFSALRRAVVMSVDFFPALRASLNCRFYLTFRDPIAVTNEHVKTFIVCKRLALAMRMIIIHWGISAKLFFISFVLALPALLVASPLYFENASHSQSYVLKQWIRRHTS